MQTKFVALPAVPANGPGGSTVVGSDLPGSYPAGTQLYLWVDPRTVAAVVPAHDGKGCVIVVAGRDPVLYCAATADEAMTQLCSLTR